jgi:hypothetical protein
MKYYRKSELNSSDRKKQTFIHVKTLMEYNLVLTENNMKVIT